MRTFFNGTVVGKDGKTMMQALQLAAQYRDSANLNAMLASQPQRALYRLRQATGRVCGAIRGRVAT